MSLMNLVASLTLDSKQFEEGLDGSQKKARTFASTLKGGFSAAVKAGAVAVGVTTAAVVGLTKSIIANSSELAAYGDNIDKMSQKMGLSIEAYQEWDAVLQHSGTSIEAMQASMKTLANAVETGNDAFRRIGLTQEQIASMSQEELFEATIAGLQNIENVSERTYLAGQLLGRGATELGALLNTSAEDTQAMRDRVHELGGVMSEEAVKAAAAYQDNLQDLQTAMSGVKRGIVSDMLPSLNTLMAGFTSLIVAEEGAEEKIAEGFEGLGASIGNAVSKVTNVFEKIMPSLVKAVISNTPVVTKAMLSMVRSMADGIIRNAGIFLSAGGQIVGEVASGIMEMLPEMVQTGIELISGMAEGIAEGLPVLLENSLPMLVEWTGSLRENIGLLVDAGITLVKGIADGMIEALPTLIENVPLIITNIMGIINDNVPTLLLAGLQILLAIGSGIIENIPVIIENAGSIVTAIISVITAMNWLELGSKLVTLVAQGIKALMSLPVEAFKSIGRSIIQTFQNGFSWSGLGRNIINGIVSGLKSAGHAIVDTLVGFAKDALDSVKKFLGISSPSKVFRDEVGKMLPAGMALGIEDTADLVKDAMKKVSDDAFATIEVQPRVSGIGTTYGEAGINQVINIHSPTQVDPSETARQARNANRELVLALRGV